jgi:hypothetical protein
MFCVRSQRACLGGIFVPPPLVADRADRFRVEWSGARPTRMPALSLYRLLLKCPHRDTKVAHPASTLSNTAAAPRRPIDRNAATACMCLARGRALPVSHR